MAIIGTQSLSQLVTVNANLNLGQELQKTVFDSEWENRFLNNFRPLSSQTEALKAACEGSGSGSSVLFTGASGVGKSSLLFLLAKLLTVPFPSELFSSFTATVSDVQAVRSVSALRNTGRKWLAVLPSTLTADNFAKAMHEALLAALSSQDGSEFVPKEATPVQELAGTAEFLRNKSSHDGIAIICDSAEVLVEAAAGRAHSELRSQLVELTELCRDSRLPILLIAAADCDMDNLSLEQENSVLDIFRKVQPVSILGKVGEWEELVSQTILSHSDDEAWQGVADYKDFRAVAESVGRIGLYQSASDKWVADTVMRGAYPLHPSALFALPRVALCLGCKGKTAFDFFSDAAPGGFVYFLRNFAVVQPNGRLHLYTADSLYTYFEKVFQDDPANAEYVAALQKAIMIAGDIPQARRILRMVLIIQLVGHERFRSTVEHIIWAMHLGDKETRVATHSLELLKEKGALLHLDNTDEYVLPIERKRQTLEEALPRARNRVRSQFDLCAVVRHSLPWKHIAAQQFNEKFSSDRQAFVKVFSAAELADTKGFMEAVEQQSAQVHPYHGDIMLACIVPQTEQELNRVKQQLSDGGAVNHPQLIVALPTASSSLATEALEMMALERLSLSEPPFSDPAASEHAQVLELLKVAKEKYDASMTELVDPDNLEFYYCGEKLDRLNDKALRQFVNDRIEDLIGTPPQLSLPALTTLRDSGRERRTRQKLIGYMLNCHGEIALRSDAEDMLNLLQAGLADTGIVREVRRQGRWIHFDICESIPDSITGSAYKFLYERLIGGPGANLTVDSASVITPLLKAPYGLTPAMVELLLAVLLWKSPRSLALCRNRLRALAEGRDDILEQVKASPEHIFELVGSSADWAFRYSDCSDAQKRFLDGLLEHTQADLSSVHSLWQAAYDSLEKFYQDLPLASRRRMAAGHAGAEVFRCFLQVMGEHHDKRTCLEEVFPSMIMHVPEFSWEQQADELLSQTLEAMQLLKDVVPSRQRALENGLKELFFSHNGGDEGLSWYSRAAQWMSSVSQVVIPEAWSKEYLALVKACAIEESQALATLVEALDMPTLENWSFDLTSEIVERFWAMREDVEWTNYRRPCEKVSAEDTAGGIIAAVLSDSGLANMEDFLASELEWVAWPEAVAEELRGDEEDEWAAPPALSEAIPVASDNVKSSEVLQPVDDVQEVSEKAGEADAETANKSESDGDEDILMTDLEDTALQWL